MISDTKRIALNEVAYSSQNIKTDTKSAKSIINYFLKDEYRTPLLDILMEAHCDEDEVFDGFYMNADHIHDLQAHGMLVGSHSVSHPVLSKLGSTDQEREINNSFDFLDHATGGLRERSFAYPYGHPETFTAETQKLLRRAGCRFAFQLANRAIMASDLNNSYLALPRLDCNRFPHGQASYG